MNAPMLTLTDTLALNSIYCFDSYDDSNVEVSAELNPEGLYILTMTFRIPSSQYD